ncbi:MAG: hypothetical protein OEW16_01990 [Gammaproteobacteria bacterium]|nr:hypothetical protein [Gammaproteobacteria bacterium]
MNRFSLRAAALLALFLPLAALARQPVDVQIYDRTAGRLLPVYSHAGERYVAGEPGHEYEVRIRNRCPGRVLAVTSVDGVNVINGGTAAANQSGYVLDSYGRVQIDGWRKSMNEVAAFYFTSLPDSYAARTGRPDNVGVIGVALFRERVVRPLLQERDSVAAADAEPLDRGSRPDAPAAASESRRDSAKAEGMVGRLGTGHGERRDSGATWTNFERASDQPESVIRIFYDSHRNLVAQGVIPSRHYAQNMPDPFPGGFVPDP